MKRIALTLTILVLLLSLVTGESARAAYTRVNILLTTGLGLQNDWTTINAKSQPQTFSMFLDIGGDGTGRQYVDPRGVVAFALDDPNWIPTVVKPLGTVYLNPANIALYQPQFHMKRVQAARSIFTPERWVAWTRLPSIPSSLVGHTLVMQVLCWEKTGFLRYSLSNPVRLVVVPQ